MTKKRCDWVTDDPIYIQYHDEEWGNPDRLNDEQYLFEMLVLEGAQAGLSWITILKRREAYRQAFYGFDIEKCSKLTDDDVAQLKTNEKIIRNELKIRSVIKNAKAFLKIQREYGSFLKFIQSIVGQSPIVHEFTTTDDIPASDEISTSLSKALKKRGFSFVGPVICYSYLQAIGMYQDHIEDCFLNKWR